MPGPCVGLIVAVLRSGPRARTSGGTRCRQPLRSKTVHLTRLALTDFRSYAAVDVPLKPGVTIFGGPNGEGKTNLVEAVGYVATLASHRAAHDAPLIRKGADQAIIRAAVSTSANDALVEIELNAGRANRVRLNRTPLTRPRDVLGVLRTVLFAPEDLALVKGDPGERRRFLDDLLVAMAPRYAAVRADYDRVLKQRTALLKSAGPKGGPKGNRQSARGGHGHARRLGRAPGPDRRGAAGRARAPRRTRSARTSSAPTRRSRAATAARPRSSTGARSTTRPPTRQARPSAGREPRGAGARRGAGTAGGPARGPVERARPRRLPGGPAPRRA